MAKHLYAPASDNVTSFSYLSPIVPVEFNCIEPRYHAKDVGAPPSVAAMQVKLIFLPTLSREPVGQPEMVGLLGGSENG
jgi:hypothetical protein